MKHPLKNIPPVVPAVGLGLACAAARAMYYITGMDDKNLLISGHPLGILVWAITAVAVILIPVILLFREESNCQEEVPGPSFPAAVGCAALAVGLALTSLSLLRLGTDMPDRVCGILGIAGAAAALWLGICRIRGCRPFFGCNGIICLFFTLYLVDQYRTLSSNPQLQDYVFYMLSCMCMALAAYQHAAFDLGVGNRRKLLITSLLGAFLGITALYRAMDLTLCLGGTVWLLTALCPPRPKARYEEN